MFGRARLHTVGSLKDRVDIIVRLVREDLYHSVKGPKLRAVAGQIVHACPPRGDVGQKLADWCELTSVFNFIVDNVRYTGDLTPPGEKPVDLYQSPYRTLSMGLGDCDCIVGISMALLSYLGWKTWIRVSSNTGQSWDHIYACVTFDKVSGYREIVFDPTLGHNRLGDEARHAKIIEFYR